jgi:hypothetical protein
LSINEGYYERENSPFRGEFFRQVSTPRVGEVDAEKRIHATPTCGRADGGGVAFYCGEIFQI